MVVGAAVVSAPAAARSACLCEVGSSSTFSVLVSLLVVPSVTVSFDWEVF